MSTIKQRRTNMMKVLIDTFNILDPSGTNSANYKKQLEVLSDEEFDKWATSFFEDKKAQLYWEIEEFERDMDIRNIEKAANYIGIPLFEYVALPYINKDDNTITVTPQKVPVGYIHQKRMQQMLAKKNNGSTNIQQRNPKTGQVTSEDKNARNTDVETYSMVAIGANQALAEFMGPRADDAVAKNEMLSDISKNGYVSYNDLTNNPENKTSLNTLDVYFTLMGFKTNLIFGGNMLIEPRK